MADRAKKRKKLVSPHSPRVSNKRNRQSSTITPSHTGVTNGSVPTSTDYRFRLKVIASAKDVSDDVFEEAVQGLVQICFPESMLDELGADVIAAHLEQDGAPPETIQKTRSAFNTLMVQHMAHLLARYTDTPEKLGSAISAVSDASQLLHGMRETLNATNDLSVSSSNTSPTDSSGEFLSDTESLLDSSDQSSSSSENEPVQHRKADTKSGRVGRSEKKSTHTSKPPGVKQSKAMKERKREENVQLPKSRPVQETSTSSEQGKTPEEADRRVSTSWRWNVDPSKLSEDEIAKAFRKTSDLYAFHALPIMQQDQGPTAKGKVIRQSIQSVLTNMPGEEYLQWVESLRKLHERDRSMLERVVSQQTIAKRDVAHGTPAPTSRTFKVYSEEATRKQQSNLREDDGRTVSDPLPVGGPSVTLIKRERAADQEQAPLPTFGASGLSGTDSVQAAPEHVSTNFVPSGDESIDHKTPIVNLLYGPRSFGTNARNTVVQTIMDNLAWRVSARSIKVPAVNGSTHSQTTGCLRHDLTYRHVRGRRRVSYAKQLRKVLEDCLRP